MKKSKLEECVAELAERVLALEERMAPPPVLKEDASKDANKEYAKANADLERSIKENPWIPKDHVEPSKDVVNTAWNDSWGSPQKEENKGPITRGTPAEDFKELDEKLGKEWTARGGNTGEGLIDVEKIAADVFEKAFREHEEKVYDDRIDTYMVNR